MKSKQHRRHRVVKHDRTALVRSIASAIVIKDEDLFFLCDPDGNVPVGKRHGLGLYYHDCRFLNGYELRIGQSRPERLASTAVHGFEASIVLSNPDLQLEDGGLLQKEDLDIQWERIIDAKRLALCDRLSVCNHRPIPVTVTLTLRLTSSFEAMFNVRGLAMKKRGTLRAPHWQDHALTLSYDGSDNIRRTLTVQFFPEPERAEADTAFFELNLLPQQPRELLITLSVREQKVGSSNGKHTPQPAGTDCHALATTLMDSRQQWIDRQTQVHSDNPKLDEVIDRSLRDLHMLRSTLRGHTFFAAGAPWYVTLFGRDSVLSSLQMLAYEPEVAEHTLRLLAEYQGTKVDAWRDEEPGKIMHELRVGELAHTNKIPQTPYYGSIDATPLFLILLARHAAWTGRLDLFQALRGNVEAALEWMAKYGDPKGEGGYLAYTGNAKGGLINQGWKDSGDSIVNANGSLATPPIVLAEVQGYVYLAKVELAALYDRAGEHEFAARLRGEASALRERFNREFWLEDRGIYALALQDGGKPCAVVASNAGQVLWSGLADEDKARSVARRLMQEDVFNGWGIRTLSSQEMRYNPLGYHLGTVWPHDNSLIARGFRRYGEDGAAGRIFQGIFAAATHFEQDRLPEVFAGHDRSHLGIPVHYPVACHPQAWAAGSMPYLLSVLLGLEPDGFDRRLHIVAPMLPDRVNELMLRGLQVAGARIDLRFERGGDGKVRVNVVKVEGELDVDVTPSEAARGS